jgi:hypothetical protein
MSDNYWRDGLSRCDQERLWRGPETVPSCQEETRGRFSNPGHCALLNTISPYVSCYRRRIVIKLQNVLFSSTFFL